LHTGVPAGQSVLAAQPQVCEAVRQTGVVPVQVVELFEEHCRHWPARQAGDADVGHGSVELEPLSPLQAAQTWLVPSQTGELAGHSKLVLQPQTPEVVLQVGVTPPHALALPAEHCEQAPLALQAGAAAVGHGRDAADPKSPLQV
jgi:hypothetical protein